MSVPVPQAVLDVADRDLSQLAAFAAPLEGFTARQLVELVRQLDRSIDRARASRIRAIEVGMPAEFRQGMADLERRVSAMRELVEAALDRRLGA